MRLRHILAAVLVLAPSLGWAQSQLPAHTTWGNPGASQALPKAMTQAQVAAMCNVFTSTLIGCVPASSGGTTNFLRADGSWASPVASGSIIGTSTITGGVTNQLLYDNGGVFGEVTKGNNCIYSTNGSGVPSCVTSLPSGLSAAALTVTGSFTATGLVTNADLANSATTVNGQSCALGSTCTVTAVASAITVGTTTIGSGTTTRVLYDNGGLLGEYTNTQLTALINAATTSLSGALPAWPNDVTKFFGGDGNYRAVPFSSIASTPTTLAGYGITNARTALSGNVTYWVNGNSGSTAACGPTGASTCSAGSDSNDCLSAGTSCLTAQHAVNLIIRTIDLNGFNATINLAHNTGTANYAFTCTNGPVIGQSVFSINGDSGAPTAVVIKATTGAASVKDGCTVAINNVAFVDNGSNNAQVFVSVGTGGYGHVDMNGVSFGPMGVGNFVAASYAGSVTINGTNAITGSANAAFSVANGGAIEIDGTFAGSSNLTFATGFAVAQSGGTIAGVTGSTFTGFASITGPRCFFSTLASPDSVNPNTVFPGSTDCVVNYYVGAIGVQQGSGGASSIAYGTSGNCLKSGGGSGALDTWGPCAGSGVPQNVLNTQAGNYSIQTTDCGKTINATGVMNTITLPVVAGFASNCVLSVYNASNTRGQILSSFPQALSSYPNNILWPLDTVTVEIVNGIWSIQSYVSRHKLTSAITVYVDTAAHGGNDSNDCLAATTSACATIQGAINYIGTWDGNTQAITVSVADGTYTNAVVINGPFHGNPTVTLTGNTGTPANVILSTTSADAISLTNGATLTLGGFKITTATSGNGISAINASFLNITGAMNYGSIASAQLTTQAASTINITADYTISGGGTQHWNARQGATLQVSGSRTITVTGTPAFSVGFAVASTEGIITAAAATFSGSATGPSFVINTQSFLNNNAASALPGVLSTSTVSTNAFVNAPGVPVVSSCGTSPSVATGTDFSGHVTEGSSATGCTITFTTATTFGSCNASLSTGAAVGVDTLGSTLVVVHASLSGNKLYWQCQP